MDLNIEIKTEPLDQSDVDDVIERTREIIRKEFTRELEERENQVVEIQETISATKKLIAFLKYTASFDYYDIKEEIKNPERTDETVQNAPHPCIKKFLPCQMGPDFKPAPVETQEIETNSIENSELSNVLSKIDDNLTIVRGTYMLKQQFIIGNISKWIPPALREDQATHKWMLYVRIKDKDEELSKTIKKVRYFLHDSYKPHDIIDVTTSPFHLTRRGWGEFPVRVTLYFHNPQNKPVDLIHNLKLDDTYSGQQTLGNETVIEVNLIQNNIDQLIPQEKIEKEPPKNVDFQINHAISNDHDYCLKSDSKLIIGKKKVSQLGLMSSQPTQLCIYNELDAIKKYNPNTDGLITEWYTKDLLKRASNIYFFSTEACVRWLLKRWPLITKQASDPLYKRVHPYAFVSTSYYVNSNPGKRVAAEWYRSLKIKKILQLLNLIPWTTKQIFLYSRWHGYALFIGKNHFKASNDKRFINISTYTNKIDTSDQRQLELSPIGEEIDVENIDDTKKKIVSPKKSKSHIRMVTDPVIFVEQISKQIGVRFGEQEISDGIFSNVASSVLGQILKLFLDSLLRKSLCNAWLRNNRKHPGSLEVVDILKSIVESPEFDILTNVGLGSNTET